MTTSPGAPDVDLLVIGDVNPDVIVSADDPVPVFGQAERLVDGIRLTIGGSSAIVACAAARLGLRVRLAGVVGDDELGRFMLEALAARGVDVSACRVATGRRSGASVVLASASDRAILTAVGTIADLRADDVRPELARARHVHLGSFFLQPALAREVPELFAEAHEAGATTSLDPNWDSTGAWDGGFAAASAASDILLLNAVEASHLTGIDEPDAAARRLLLGGASGRPRVVAVKCGADGAVAVPADGAVARAASVPVVAVDATGAGDAFDAGFIAAWLEGRPLDAALALAVACGSLSTREVGATGSQATREEAEAAMRSTGAA